MNENEFNLEESILDFLLYYNNRAHSTTNYALNRVMKNWSDQEIFTKVQENTKKSINESKVEEFKVSQIVSISNRIIQPD